MTSERSSITPGTRVYDRHGHRCGVLTDALDDDEVRRIVRWDDGTQSSLMPEEYEREADVAALIRGILARNPEREQEKQP